MKKSRNVRWSESLHRKAARLLTSCGLIEILEKYGEVRPTGSYPANLMMHGDIDFHVICPNGFTMSEVLEVYSEIVLTGRFEQHMIWNWDKKTRRRGWRRSKGMSGYYLYLRTRCGRVKWKIDIWFLSADEETRDRKNWNVMDAKITAKQREAILAFKKLRNEAGIESCSQKIYELVLVKGMTSRTLFKKLLATEMCQ